MNVHWPFFRAPGRRGKKGGADMLASLLTVGQQVIILYLLIAVGFVCGKTKFLAEGAVTGLTNFVLSVVTPCVMIQAFQRPFDASLSAAFFQSMALAAAATLLSYVLARLTLRHSDARRQSVYRFAVLFSNCAFMGLPLEMALLGADGVFFGAACLAVFLLFTWTLGLLVMSRDRSLLQWRQLAANPGVLGVAVGLALFFTSTTLPEVLSAPISYLAALNTPVPMIIIGFHLSRARVTPILRDRRTWICQAERLIAVPLLGLGIGWLMGMNATALTACIIALCPPTAAICTMFASRYGQDTELSVSLVSLSTLLSVLTMPLMIVLAQSLPL